MGGESWIDITGAPPPTTGGGADGIAVLFANILGLILWS
jgi:hypothetical protein